MCALPSLVVAADWSTDEKKRRMVRAERVDPGKYVVFPPEPVGDCGTLIRRLRNQVREGESLLIGFDFPIGLPAAYAQRLGNQLAIALECQDRLWRRRWRHRVH
jgi:hypothetical protein